MGNRIPVAMACFDRALIRAGAVGAAVSLLVLAAFSNAQGLPVWMPLNVTTHVFFGPEVVAQQSFDVVHSVLGLTIHIVACFFWAAVMILLLRPVERATRRLAWAAGLVIALMAVLVDYAILPRFLSPGWHLILPPIGVLGGFLGMGTGIAIGLVITHGQGNAHSYYRPSLPSIFTPRHPISRLPRVPTVRPVTGGVVGGTLDPSRQRIDPANVARDPNLLDAATPHLDQMAHR